MECNSNVTLKEWSTHKESGKCQFMKELEQGKALRDLQKFQEEEQRRHEAMMKDRARRERIENDRK